MHIVIGGFGRVGRRLATELESLGHSVAVIDRDRRMFDEFGGDLKGRKLTGEVFDRETLVAAGIERADAYAAVTSGDNSNIVSARIARERFDVKCVVARIYDPHRAVIYERFGIPTVASVSWTSARLLGMLLEPDVNLEAAYGGGEVVTVSHEVPQGLFGKRIVDVDFPGKFSVSAVVRDGVALLPTPRMELVKGDHVHVTAERGAINEVKRLFGLEG